MLAITDGDPAKASALAERYGMELFELRGHTRSALFGADAWLLI